MQKSTVAELDDKIDNKIDSTVPGNVRSILISDLDAKAFKNNKKRKPGHMSSFSGSNKETKKDDQENAETKAINQPIVSSTAMVSPVLQQTQQAFVDANDQQFVMMPVNLGQNQLLQYEPANA